MNNLLALPLNRFMVVTFHRQNCVFLACQLDVELDPDFVFYLHSASRNTDRLDTEVRQFEERAPDVVSVPVADLYRYGPGLPVQPNIAIPPPATLAHPPRLP